MLTSLGSHAATVRVDMMVSAGNRAQLFVNDPTATPPIDASIEPGVRRSYKFPGVRDDVSSLRLDPTDAAGVEVRIYGIEVAASGRVLTRLGPDDLRQWTTFGLVSMADEDAYAFRTVSVDPILVTPAAIPLPTQAPRWRWALRDLLVDRAWLLGPLVALVLVCADTLATRQRGTLLLLAGAPVLVALAAPLTTLVPAWGRSTDIAVSRATWLGESVTSSQVVLLACLVAWTGLAFVLARRRGSATPVPPAMLPDAARASVAMLAAGGLAVVLALTPDVPRQLAGLAQPFVAQWDADNVHYWAYLTHIGAKPFKDFWYTYGAYYLFDRPWPTGLFAKWAYEALLYGSLWTAIWLLAPKRRVAGLVVVLAMMASEQLGLVASSRYLLATVVVLSCAGARRLPAPHAALVLIVPLGLAVTFEPPQLVYAAPSLGALYGLDWYFSRGRDANGRGVMTSVVILAAVSAVTLTTVTLLLWRSGQLSGAWEFYRHLGDVARYGTFPTRIDALGWSVLALPLMTLWWPIAVSGIGVHECFAGDTDQARARGTILLLLGLVAFMTLQKHLVRPMEAAFTGQILLASLMYLLLMPGQVTLRGAIACGLLLGLACTDLTMTGRGARLAATLASLPERGREAVAILTDPAASQAVNERRFAADRLLAHPAERELVSELERRTRDGGLSVFALSDAPMLYMMTGQPPMWQSNMYNASPVREQHRIVQWLQEQPPDFVVFDRSRLVFDDMHVAVRVPLIVAAVAARYMPDAPTATFDVLRPREPEEVPDVRYWAEALGSTIDIGRLPSAVDVSSRAPCEAGQECLEYLAVAVKPQDADGRELTLSFRVADVPFDVMFRTEQGRTEYIVPVGALWFGRVAATMAEPVTLVAGAGADMTWRPVRLASSDAVLY